MSNEISVGDVVRILAPHSIYYLWTAPVTAVSPTGSIQVEAEPGVLDLFSVNDVKKV